MTGIDVSDRAVIARVAAQVRASPAGGPPAIRPVFIRALAGLVGTLFLAVALVIITGAGGHTAVVWTDDLGQFVIAATAGGSALWAARRSTSRSRAGWLAIGLGLVGWSAGQLLWCVNELMLQRKTLFPAWSDVGFLMFPAGAVTGLWLLPDAAGARSRTRRLLDGAMVAASLVAVGSSTTLDMFGQASQLGPLGALVSLAYPVGDILVLTMAVLTLTSRAAQRRVLLLLVLGLSAMAVADSWFAYVSAQDQYQTGSLLDVFWLAAFLLIAVAALAAVAGTANDRRQPSQPAGSATMLPYLPFILALLVENLSGQPAAAGRIGLVVAMLAVLGRQYLVLKDNVTLLKTVAAREEQLVTQAFRDVLTGLANRALFTDRVSHALALHDLSLRPVSLLFIDLDDFKAVNDTLGHGTGDQLLVRVGERLLGALRPGDTLARFGGDEFAVLIEDSEDPVLLGQRIVDVLRTPFQVDVHQISVRASVGAADLAPEHPTLTLDQLFARADIAMYSAKRAGKGQVALYHPSMVLPEAADLKLRPALVRAITDHHIEAHFQPIVDLADGRIRAVETLARWHHDGQYVAAGYFIPLASRSGVLDELTDQMLDLTCAQLSDWTDRLGAQDLQASVNIPPVMLKDTGFPGRLAAVLGRHGLPGRRLILEITEDALLDDVPAVVPVIAAIRALGVELALDDFGTGYSSLLSLRQIPLHSVKIDIAFVAGIDRDPEALRFLRAMLALSRDLNLRVTAEGVERPEQERLLRAYGCDSAQGFLYSRAVTAAVLEPLLVRSLDPVAVGSTGRAPAP